MGYNKVKRGLEKGAGIYSTIISGLELIGFLVLFIRYVLIAIQWGGFDVYYVYLALPYIVVSFLFMIFSITKLILSAMVIKTPVQEDGTVKDRKGLRIALAIFSFLSGEWITLGLIIAVLCLKDFVSAKNVQIPQQQINPVQQPQQTGAPLGVEAKIAQLKQLKELGVITEEVYRQAIEKIINQL